MHAQTSAAEVLYGTNDSLSRVARTAPSADVRTIQIGAVAGIVGALLAMVGNLMHPVTPTADPQGVAQVIAASERWVAVHLTIDIGLILMLGGLIAVGRSLQLEGGLPGALSRLAQATAVAGVTVGLILVTLDGVAAKHLADAWLHAPGEERAIALRLVTSEETLNFALAALFNILFAGMTFILFGLAVARSRTYPHWLGWLAVIAGVGSVAIGVVQASVGESTALTKAMTIVFPTVITLWLALMGMLLLTSRASRSILALASRASDE